MGHDPMFSVTSVPSVVRWAVAGLAVGAPAPPKRRLRRREGVMGVFILGLYLRAWLRERKALAGEP